MGQARPPRRIALVVEDDAELRWLSATLLEESELDIVECESAEAALAVMLMRGPEVAMIFADIAFLRDGKRFLKFVGSAVPNAYFERTIDMIERVHTTARAYIQGLLKLTAIDTVCLGVGLWVIGVPGAPVLGLLAAVLAWVPFVGPIIAGIIVVLVTATDLPHDPDTVYAAIALLVCVRLLDDFVIARADRTALYNFAVAVDDTDMGITHVVRGEDHLSNTPRQLLVLQALGGTEPPRYAHLPVAVNAAGEKLSKQTLAAPLDAAQPLPALVAALSFLGQQPPRGLASATVRELWDWAMNNWKLERVAHVASAPVPGDRATSF